MQYSVGIDLGTTNSAIAYTDGASIKLLRIPQLNGRGVEESLTTLPSFYYLADPAEWPHTDFAVGMWAREQGSKVPTRLIQSAKSWLSNAAANRKERILPIESIDPSRRLSPVEVSASYLRHLASAWSRAFELPLEEQDVIITVPASFDEVARSLTVESARLAGLTRVTLLEEPQAAFYNWLMEHEERIGHFQEGETILVCDVGGGTTDFSLIRVMQGHTFQRTAVGRHLLLGGDNMDAALCYYLEGRLEEKLETTQWLALRHQSRLAKEALLSGGHTFSIWIPGKGQRVVGGGHKLEITAQEVASILIDGFFGLYDFKEAQQQRVGSAIRTMGLPYEREPSITKHLAAFLKSQESPTYLLFNGGSMKPTPFQERIIQSIALWFPNAKPVQNLPSSSLDLAVARGAAYYGKVRQGKGIRIEGGIPRAYYLAISKQEALTLLPRGTIEGTEIASEHTFSLLPNTPVSFELYHSHTRLGDGADKIIPIEEEEMTLLPPIHTLLRFGSHHSERIPVKLTIALTEIGTLELWLLSLITPHRWKLEFQLNGYTKERRLGCEIFDEAFLEPAKKGLAEAFSVGNQTELKALMSTLERILERPRIEWPPSILRSLFETLMSHAEKRSLSLHYESRFWNLVGFFLRPGLGCPLDDFRIKRLWKLILTDLPKPASEEAQIQKWICYRRIAAGLVKGQQMQLCSVLLPLLYNKKKQQLISNRKEEYAYAERVRAFAALEHIDLPVKVKIAEALVDKIGEGRGSACDFWALGRIGARGLLYGTLASVVPPSICEQWIARLIKISDPRLASTLALLASPSDIREVNISTRSQEAIHKYFEQERLDLALLNREGELSLQEQEWRFGDSLPPGLFLNKPRPLPDGQS